LGCCKLHVFEIWCVCCDCACCHLGYSMDCVSRLDLEAEVLKLLGVVIKLRGPSTTVMPGREKLVQAMVRMGIKKPGVGDLWKAAVPGLVRSGLAQTKPSRCTRLLLPAAKLVSLIQEKGMAQLALPRARSRKQALPRMSSTS
jgi:hypothetical protein